MGLQLSIGQCCSTRRREKGGSRVGGGGKKKDKVGREVRRKGARRWGRISRRIWLQKRGKKKSISHMVLSTVWNGATAGSLLSTDWSITSWPAAKKSGRETNRLLPAECFTQKLFFSVHLFICMSPANFPPFSLAFIYFIPKLQRRMCRGDACECRRRGNRGERKEQQEVPPGGDLTYQLLFTVSGNSLVAPLLSSQRF